MTTLTKSTGTVTLTGSAEKVTLPAAYGWVWLKNMSDADMFAGLSADISEGADGVMVIPSGECGRIQTDGFNSIYLMGTGNALVVAQNYADCPFKVGAKGGEIPDLSAYAKTADVPNIKVNAAVNADTVGGHTVGCDVPENAVFTDTVPDLSPYAKKTDIRNENLLINPDFKINQRGSIDFRVDYHAESPISQSQKYTVDRWRIMEGRANISNGKFVLTGTIIQVLENSIGSDFTATVSVESGTATASYNDSTKTFTIVGNSAVLKWAKLEHGSIATPFFPPDPTTELLKCKRYFETKSISAKGLAPDDSWIEGHIFDVPKRAIPSISLTSLLGTPDTLSEITGADSEIKIVGYSNATVDRINGSSCSKALGYITYNYCYTADAEIY